MNKKNTYYLMDNLIFDALGRVEISNEILALIPGGNLDNFLPTSFVDVYCDGGCGQNPYCGNNASCNTTNSSCR
jgi:hypothetical protein